MADPTDRERNAPTPNAQDNGAPFATMLKRGTEQRQASSRHTTEAREELFNFLVTVMEECEYARQSPENGREVRLELSDRGIGVADDDHGSWYHALVSAHYTKEERKEEKTNISKYVAALCNAKRIGKGLGEIKEFLRNNGIAKLATAEAAARRKERDDDLKAQGKETPAEKAEKQRDAAIKKHRKKLELPADIELPAQGFSVLVVEVGRDGTWLVGQATKKAGDLPLIVPDLFKAAGASAS